MYGYMHVVVMTRGLSEGLGRMRGEGESHCIGSVDAVLTDSSRYDYSSE